MLLAAELKRIPYESRLLEFSKGDLTKPEFLALNPRGKVPVIRDGDVVLAEFAAAMRAKWNGEVVGGIVLHP